MNFVISHVVDGSLRVCIALNSVKLSRTPKMSSGAPQPELQLPFKKFIRRYSVRHMKCLQDAHRCWNIHEEMERILHHRHFKNPDAVAFSHCSYAIFEKIYDPLY